MIAQNDALLFFYCGEKKNPEKMSDKEWCLRTEQINWVLRYTGVIEVKQKDLEIEHLEEEKVINGK